MVVPTSRARMFVERFVLAMLWQFDGRFMTTEQTVDWDYFCAVALAGFTSCSDMAEF